MGIEEHMIVAELSVADQMSMGTVSSEVQSEFFFFFFCPVSGMIV